MRTTPKPITAANIANEVNFGILDCSEGGLLKGIENLLSKVMIPALSAQGNWGVLTEGETQNTAVVNILRAEDILFYRLHCTN